jgi:hypothetical protein
MAVLILIDHLLRHIFRIAPRRSSTGLAVGTAGAALPSGAVSAVWHGQLPRYAAMDSWMMACRIASSVFVLCADAMLSESARMAQDMNGFIVTGIVQVNRSWTPP